MAWIALTWQRGLSNLCSPGLAPVKLSGECLEVSGLFLSSVLLVISKVVTVRRLFPG
jgi:hypothetical protein